MLLIKNILNLEEKSLFIVNNFKTNFDFFIHIEPFFLNNIGLNRLESFVVFSNWNVFNQLKGDYFENFEFYNYLFNQDYKLNFQENLYSLYSYSIPNIKLAYPEPYIASASLMHNDLWFIHILIYQYWLWFVFIFMITFFLITFSSILRWCGLRIRPRRETRGVSRSKCGDLITAVVPVSWAASIIINESTDAIDYYDGFGTTELVIGIRAYQWGWEYYYPKDIDLNYDIKTNNSIFIGNSLKYSKSSEMFLNKNNFWKYYQNKLTDQIILPSHFILFSSNYYKLINILNFTDIGSNPLNETLSFKKIKTISKNTNIPLSSFTNQLEFFYKKTTPFYLNYTSLDDLTFFNFKRQTNFVSPVSFLSNTKNLINFSSFDKLINFNFNLSYFQESNPYFYFSNNINFNEKNYPQNLFFFNNLQKFAFLNTNSDLKNTSNPLLKIWKISSFLPYNFENFMFINLNESFSIINKNNLNKNFDLFSASQSILTSEKSIRKWTNLGFKNSRLNYTFSNTTIYLLNKLNTTNTYSYNFIKKIQNSQWIHPQTLVTLGSSVFSSEYPQSPISSNRLFYSLRDFDNPRTAYSADSSLILQGKEESTPNSILSIYWNFHWAPSSTDWRLLSNLKFNQISNNLYLNPFTFYYDYDFKNWQNFDLLEDFYWEHTTNLSCFDEYASFCIEFNKISDLNKEFNFFNLTSDKVFKKNLNQFLYKNCNMSPLNVFNNSMFFDDLFFNGKTSHYFYLNKIIDIYNFNLIEEAFDNKKSYATQSIFNFHNNLDSYNNFFYPNTYSNVFNFFRSDLEENYPVNTLDSNRYSNLLNYKNLTSFDYSQLPNKFCPQNLTNDHFLTRNDSQLILRNSIKNSLVTFNAIQKVFKSRFDELRSNSKLEEISNSFSRQLFIANPRIKYESILGKNKQNFFNHLVFKQTSLNTYTKYGYINLFNFGFFDFPFLLGLKSDSSKHMWFDWFSKWLYLDIQPASSSKYAIHGMPFHNKIFDFNGNYGEIINETETYFTRLSKARKNYLANWSHSSFFLLKNIDWFKHRVLNNILLESQNDLFNLNIYLNTLDFDIKKNWSNQVSFNFNPTYSHNFSYTKSLWKTNDIISSYYYNLNKIVDVCTKRDFLYRQFLFSNGKIINLPLIFTNSISNDVIRDVKSLFFFTDPTNITNELSKNSNTRTIDFSDSFFLKNILWIGNEYWVFNVLDRVIFSFWNQNTNSYGNNNVLFKNQYRPLRKGITNMIRLQASGVMVIPTEVRIQILASSKDVIHSWAIPSAGVKIDCVPGYSSHKTVVFFESGIYWGQCMEVCGRYHHWMPIVAAIVKRDSFFLWLTHFNTSSNNNVWNINDRLFADFINLPYYDNSDWVQELVEFKNHSKKI